MTVRELIELLDGLDGNLPVMGSDCEQGMYDIERAEVSEPWGFYPKHVVLT